MLIFQKCSGDVLDVGREGEEEDVNADLELRLGHQRRTGQDSANLQHRDEAAGHSLRAEVDPAASRA